jgi:hypothetical protein
VTRPGRAPRGLAALFGSDPSAAVRQVVREADTGVTAAQIKRTLHAAGVAELDRRTWGRLQRRLRVDDHIAVEPGYRYRFVAHPVALPATEAFDRIVRAAGNRVSPTLVNVVRAALLDAPHPAETAAQQRQAVLDGVRALAELASEVEELAVSQASTRAMIHRVRSRVKLAGLEPIERAGEQARFNRRRHQSIGAPIDDDAPVLVLRPGYAWSSSSDEVLVAKAAVQE